MICVYIPKALAELYHAQGWAVTPLGHHGEYSFLACREQKDNPAP